MSDTPPPTAGVHHVTAVVGDPAAHLDFYTGTLGLRLVKRTVNFDDPSTYHLYFADADGTPGSVFTVFPMPDAPAGEVGDGQVTVTAFAVPEGSIDDWAIRLRGDDRAGAVELVGDDRIGFVDPSGLRLELAAAPRAEVGTPWTAGVGDDMAIHGFDGIRLASRDRETTAEVLEHLGFARRSTAGSALVLEAEGPWARAVHLEPATGAPGRSGRGTVHHVAFRVPDGATQLAWREALLDDDLSVTDVRDRRYFRSIYFREPGGVLFEFATDGPGFTVDEAADDLGSSLRLPPWLEGRAGSIEAGLPPLSPPSEGGR